MKPLVSAIKGISFNGFLRNISSTHCWAIKLGRIADIYTANNILNHYVKCSSTGLIHASKLFDEMPHGDIVTWNTIISGYVNSGEMRVAWNMLNSMRRSGLEADGYTLASILKGVSSDSRVDLGQQVHSLILKLELGQNVYASSSLLDMYAKCERVEDAFVVFQSMPERNSVSWNALLAGFVQVGDRETAFWLFGCMDNEGVGLEDGTFSPLLTLLNEDKFYRLTMQLHCKIIKHGLDVYTTVCNALIISYSECGSLGDAKRAFSGAFGSIWDLVTWNSLLAAFLVHDETEGALKLFMDMQRLGLEPDVYSYASVLSACFDKQHKEHGRLLHGLVIKRGLEHLAPICNAMMTMYLKTNTKSIDDALNVFHAMTSKDHVSWNSILTGFSQTGFSEDALKLFGHMRYLQVETDHYAFSAALRSCSDLAMLQLGQQIHILTIKFGLELNDFVASSLIVMYSKCGLIEEARKSFEETSKDNSITWNSILFAYAQHGHGNAALDLFSQMRVRKVKLDHVTFVAVLTACSHIGLVEQGRQFLKSMASDYGIPPRMEHYACAVDLFGRAGYLDEAKALIESMPFKPDAMVWRTYLGACRACGNIELASQVATHLLEVEPEEHCTYVILSDMYGHLKRWGDKATVTRLMRERLVKKVPGWSWIEVNNKIHAFNAEDQRHSQCEEIYEIVARLMQEIKWLDSLVSVYSLIQEIEYIYRYCS